MGRKKERGTKTDETVTMDDIFKPQEECAHPRTVLIEGTPGIGKTTLCNKLAYDWATKKTEADDLSGSFFPNFQVVLLLKCREIESYLWRASEGRLLSPSEKEKANEVFASVLWDAIDDQLLPRDVTKEDKEEFFKFIRHNQSDILLVLDGLDELPTNMLAAFKEVLQGRMLTKCHIVATARQEVGMEVREFCDKLLEIEGFTTNDARKFIVKYFKEDAHLAEKLLNKLKLDEDLRQLTESPLNTVLLCLLCEDFDGIFPESATQLYLEIVECVLRRYNKKNGLPLPKAKGEDLTKVYKTQLKQLGSIALKGLLQNNMSFDKSEFKDCAVELPEYGFLSVEFGRSKMWPSLNYCFLHKTFQELFAAFYICCQLVNNEVCPENITTDTRYFHELKQVLLFTCGLLASQSEEKAKALIASIADHINNRDELLFALQCIGECRNDASSSLHLLLSRFLGSNIQITELDLSQTLLRLINYSVFPEVIKHDAEFHLPYNEPATGRLTALVEVLKHNSTITQLNLSYNGLGVGDCTALAEAIKQNSTITQLDLSNNDIGFRPNHEPLVVTIKSNSTIIAELKFPLRESDCTALAEAIKQNSTITLLNLSRNELGAGDCTSMAEAIKHNSTITKLNLSNNKLGTGNCTALALEEAIKQNSTITQLDLSGNKLGTGDCTALAEAIKHNSTITQLGLSENELGTGNCTALEEAIKHNSTITELDLSVNQLGTADCTALAEAIKQNSTITRLNLFRNKLGTGDCTALAEAIKHHSSITQLGLSDNELGTGNCTALAEAIKHNPTITELDMSRNQLGTGDCTALVEAIKQNSAITRLDLRGNRLGTGDYTALAEAIKQNSKLTHLDLAFNNLSAGNCTALAKAIKHNSITELNLSWNALGTGDPTALAEAIKYNSTITQLNLTANGLGTGDCTVLAEAIKHNSTIRQLDLRGNGLGTGDYTALADAIKHNSTITQLNLSRNKLGSGDCTALTEAIKHNSTITELNLSDDELGTGDCTALVEAIKYNSAITQLDLSGNKLGSNDPTALADAIKHNLTITKLNLSGNHFKAYDGTALAEAIKHNSLITVEFFKKRTRFWWNY